MAEEVIKSSVWAIWALSCLIGLSACQNAGPYVAYDPSVLEQVQSELEKSRDAASAGNFVVPPNQVLRALLPQIAFTQEEAEEVDARFDFSVTDLTEQFAVTRWRFRLEARQGVSRLGADRRA